jgi:hypothetical protein
MTEETTDARIGCEYFDVMLQRLVRQSSIIKYDISLPLSLNRCFFFASASTARKCSVSINCAHLHPQYGMPTPEEQLASLKHEDQEGEVDVNLQEYKKRRDEARRSPYPSVIVEVMSTPPPDFGSRRDEAAMEEASARDAEGGAGRAEDENGVVTSDDVRRLEALFAMSAAKKSTSADDPFYDALGEVRGYRFHSRSESFDVIIHASHCRSVTPSL